MTSTTPRPWQASLVGVIVFLEALLMLGVGLWSIVSALGLGAQQLLASVFLGVICFGVAFWLVQCGRAILDGKPWARAGTVAWQVLQAGVGIGTFNGGEGPVLLAFALIVPAVVAFVFVLRKQCGEWLAREMPKRSF
ncbi:hypothetical protein [Humidisolicoccus flavus]|uniref:hypothetical protein n=1 Tax=Humidisolicoccus flavus TaxID=3111414 RepID=UPI00324ACE61